MFDSVIGIELVVSKYQTAAAMISCASRNRCGSEIRWISGGSGYRWIFETLSKAAKPRCEVRYTYTPPVRNTGFDQNQPASDSNADGSRCTVPFKRVEWDSEAQSYEFFFTRMVRMFRTPMCSSGSTESKLITTDS